MADDTFRVVGRPKGPSLRTTDARVADGFQNFEARLGLGTDNASSSAQYNPTFLTRNRVELDNMYRGTWIVRQVVGVVAEDMTRAGVEIVGTDTPDDAGEMQNALRRKDFWGKLTQATKWARLYGGALAVMMIDGQDLSTPLRPETVRRGQFRGLMVLDRWMVQPAMNALVTDFGPDFGKPLYYDVVINSDQQGQPRIRGAAVETGQPRIHYSRVVRLEGDDLPFFQRQYENGWGMSVVEPFQDRLVAFDSTTMGIAQLVYRAYLRTYKMKNLRKTIADGGAQFNAAMANVDIVRRFQNTEGLTLIDSEDDFSALTYQFGGLSDVLVQMSQQISGATGIPVVKLFGMSPAGFSTGETDLRSYYDNVNLRQERDYRHGLERALTVEHWSCFGRAPGPEFGFKFSPLWGMSSQEKATVATAVANAVMAVESTSIIPRSTALRELKNSSQNTGIFSEITDEMIEAAEADEAAAAAEPPLPDVPAPGEENGDAGAFPDDEEAAADEPVADNEEPGDAPARSPSRPGAAVARALTIGAPRLAAMPGGRP